MKLSLKIFTIIIFTAFCASAQKSDSTYWKKGGFGSITFSRIALKNWAGGGQSSVSINGVANFFADYARDRATWQNSLDLGYGLIRQGNNGNLIKSDDKINLVSKFGYKIKKENQRWFYSGILDFRTQFNEGLAVDPVSGRRNVVISDIFAPAYLTIGLGIDYKPSPAWSFNYVPLTGKFTFVNDQTLADIGAFGVPDGSNARGEFGSFFRATYVKDIVKNVNLDSRIELFTNYVTDFPTVDVSWQNSIVMKVNEFLTANFFYQLIYDKDIDTVAQQKSVFGVGLSKSFGAKRG